MFRSLRFRLPALFLVSVVLTGLVSGAIATRLLQDALRDRSLSELRREAAGLAELYADQAIRATDENTPAVPAKQLERVTGNRLFYVGAPIDPKRRSAVLTELPQSTVPDWRSGRVIDFEFVPPGESRTFLAVAHPLRVGTGAPQFGSLVVATPRDVLRSRVLTLVGRLALALAIGVLVAGALALYLSRRLTSPVLQLAEAADEVARGNYEVAVPEAGGDEIGNLAERFREMAHRLQEAEQLERRFLLSVSHELRTPLTAIRGHIDALREGLAQDPDERQRSLTVVAAETERLERLVGDVLDLAKLNARRFNVRTEEVDMARLLERAYAFYGEEARRRGIEYRQDVAARPVITSDGDRVLQIISNLLSNAFRWTPDGGRVDLALSAADGAVRVAVEDTGPGIRAEEQQRIFRPFWTRDGRGTGLGLAIAHELAIALGGSIALHSRAGEGSRFELVLPAKPPGT
jgi:signal transduction histidine kinase